MAYPVKIICWDHCHMNEIPQTKKQAESLPKRVAQGKAVCPDCRNEGLGNKPFEVIDSPALLRGGTLKPYRCRHGHLTVVSAFASDMFHVRFGPAQDAFENVPGKLEELAELIDKKEIACNHTVETKNGGTRKCNCKLTPLDDSVVTSPRGLNFKTKTRIGDIWDREGLEPVRPSTYDKEGNVSESRTDKANRERLRRMQKQNRNVEKDRLPAHRAINETTEKRYRRRDKHDIDDVDARRRPR